MKRRGQDIIYQELGAEAVIYMAWRNTSLILNETARSIWNLCKNTTEERDIASALCSEFQVDERVALKDVRRILKKFRELELLG